jgi:hypothetical protein
MDYGGSAANVTGFIHVMNGSSGEEENTVTITLQHSGDDSAWSDLVAFTIVSACPGVGGSFAEIKHATGGSRYMRYEWLVNREGIDEYPFNFVATAVQS